MATSEKHETTLKTFLKELELDGYKVLDLQRKCPDGIAVKDGKIYAIEVLGRRYVQGKGNVKKWTYARKRQEYDMFEDVLFKTFVYDVKRV